MPSNAERALRRAQIENELRAHEERLAHLEEISQRLDEELCGLIEWTRTPLLPHHLNVPVLRVEIVATCHAAGQTLSLAEFIEQSVKARMSDLRQELSELEV